MHAHMPPYTQPEGAYDSRLAAGARNATADPVNKPAHYQRGGIETIDYIRASLGPELFEGYCVGNALKYVSRYRDKGGVQDLEKASVYLRWAIDAVVRTAPPAAIYHPVREAKYPPTGANGWANQHPMAAEVLRADERPEDLL